MRKKHETDVTDERWEIIKPLFVNMRKRKWEKARAGQCCPVLSKNRVSVAKSAA